MDKDRAFLGILLMVVPTFVMFMSALQVNSRVANLDIQFTMLGTIVWIAGFAFTTLEIRSAKQ